MKGHTMFLVLTLCLLPFLMVSLAQVDPTDFRGCEVVFGMDMSSSMTSDDYDKIKNFVGNIIQVFPNYGTPEGVRSGIVTFADDAKIESGLNHLPQKLEKRKLISDLIFWGGKTRTDLAIGNMSIVLNQGLARNKKAGVIITDGVPEGYDHPLDYFHALTVKAAQDFMRNRLLIIIGIGPSLNENRVVEILGGNRDRFHQVTGFEDLVTISNEILRTVCVPPCTRRGYISTCRDCEYKSGIYVFEDCQRCDVFRQCLQSEMGFPEARSCPFGQFFDFKKSTCLPAALVNCTVDKCLDSSITAYPDISNCRIYWRCLNLRTVQAYCCPPGEKFDGTSCVPDATCNTQCPPVHSKAPCTSRAIAGQETLFEKETHDGIWKRMICAPGSLFVPATCDCSDHRAPLEAPACAALIELPFTRNVQPTNRRIKVNNQWRVRVGANGAQFNGRQFLRIPHFAQAISTNKLTVRLKFQEDRSIQVNGVEVLYGNGNCGEKQSISLKYDRANNVVEAKIVIAFGMGSRTAEFKVSVTNVPQNIEKIVDLQYDGTNPKFELSLSVNAVKESVRAFGQIVRRMGSVVIGSGCADGVPFAGAIDDFSLYKCVPA